MRLRLAAGAILIAAAAVYLGLARPLREDGARALEEYRRLREERRLARARLIALERREAADRRATGALGAGAGAKGDALGALRRSVLASLQGTHVSRVRLEVRPAAPPVAASVHLSTEGSYPEVLALCGRIAGPGTAVVLTQVKLTPANGHVTLELDGSSLGGAP